MSTMEIKSLLAGLADAWNRGDATAYANLFTADADYITFFGMRTRGRDAIEQSHRMLFTGPLRGSRMSGTTEADIRFLATDVALVIAEGGGTTSGPGADDAADRRSVVSFTAVHTPDGWRFASFQNTRVTTPPGKPS